MTNSFLRKLTLSCNFDIRSCINTLQFSSTKKDFTQLQLGGKDEGRNVFSIWKMMLSKKEAEEKRKEKENMSVEKKEFMSVGKKIPLSVTQYLVGEVNALNDTSLVLQGVHENYLSTAVSDLFLSSTSTAAEWFSYSNFLEGNVRLGINSEYALLNYIPHCLGAIHILIASPNRVNVQWPKKVSFYFIFFIRFLFSFLFLSSFLSSFYPLVLFFCFHLLEYIFLLLLIFLFFSFYSSLLLLLINVFFNLFLFFVS